VRRSRVPVVPASAAQTTAPTLPPHNLELVTHGPERGVRLRPIEMQMAPLLAALLTGVALVVAV